jgi:hypothetical protein
MTALVDAVAACPTLCSEKDADADDSLVTIVKILHGTAIVAAFWRAFDNA